MTLHCVNYLFFLLNRIETITVSITKDKNLARRNIALNIRTVLYLLSTVPSHRCIDYTSTGLFLPRMFSPTRCARFTGRDMASPVKLHSRVRRSPRVPAMLEKLHQRDQTLGHGVNGPFVLLILFFLFKEASFPPFCSSY